MKKWRKHLSVLKIVYDYAPFWILCRHTVFAIVRKQTFLLQPQDVTKSKMAAPMMKYYFHFFNDISSPFPRPVPLGRPDTQISGLMA